MAFNAYIQLDGKKYATVARNWSPQVQKPMTVRQLSNGDLDVTYGQKALKFYAGEIVANVSETPARLSAGWGTSSDIETSLEKMQGLAFVDHYGNSFTVHIGGWKKRSLSPAWGGASNKLYYEVRLIYA